MNTSKLIRTLSEGYQKKPFWKKRGVLLTAWFAFNIIYFIVITFFFSSLELRTSVTTLGISIFTSVLGWIFFAKLLNADESEGNVQLFGLTSIVLLLGVGFLIDEFMSHNILHQRPLGFMRGDLNCFTHIAMASIFPLIVGSLLIRFFFVGKKTWALIFFALHISLMATLWTEMTCSSRELWHLILGHEASILAVLGIFLILSYWQQRRVSSIV